MSGTYGGQCKCEDYLKIKIKNVSIISPFLEQMLSFFLMELFWIFL